jgi:hypothetical protein
MRLPATLPAQTRPLATVPERYHGVWVRTLLETPEGEDRTTWVRWLQTELWHADLRVPAGLDRRSPAGLAQQQGFCGTTHIARIPGQADVCTWQRRSDFQPPRSTPDAGHMVFDTPDRLVEIGVHGAYREVWERLPESLGPQRVLAALDAQGQPTPERLLVSGACLMHVRPRTATWPADGQPDDTLADVLHRHPAAAAGLLDFDIACGHWGGEVWTVERATRPALEGQRQPCTLRRTSEGHAEVESGDWPRHWQVLAWSGSDHA